MEPIRHTIDVSTETLITLLERRQIILKMDLSFRENFATSFELKKNESALQVLSVIKFYQEYLQYTDSQNRFGTQRSTDEREEYSRLLVQHQKTADAILNNLNPPLAISPQDDRSGHVGRCYYCLEKYNRAIMFEGLVKQRPSIETEKQN